MRFFIFSILVLISAFCLAQRKSVVAFYNVENLFDTIDQPGTIDEEFLPSSKKQWNSERYTDKVNKLAFIMSQIGDSGTDAPDIIGLAEVENRSVIEDLIKNENLSRFKYGIVHEDSPDARGIDVAL
ncbi:MAG: endonuclease/exonuclease/phosphatase family protein, partial [Luteibaculum sp.]